MKEIWRDIPGYKGQYQVSNFGSVRSLARYRGANGGRFWQEERALKKTVKSTGYEQVGLCRGNRSIPTLVHRLVASAFVPNPSRKPQVNHKDGNKANNHVKNLEWVTSSENGQHAYRVLGHEPWHKGIFGKGHPKSRAVIQKTLAGEFVKKWDCMMDAQREAGFRTDGICRACKGIYQQYKGHLWEYAT